MNNYSAIYWLTRVDYFVNLFGFLSVLSFVILFFWYISFFINCADLEVDTKEFIKKWGKYRKSAFIVCLISSALFLFTPSKNDIILIYAGGKTMDYVESDTSLRKIPYQTTKIISDYLDKTISELNK